MYTTNAAELRSKLVEAWRYGIVSPTAPANGANHPDRAAWLGVFLEGLPLLFTGEVHDETEGGLTLERAVHHVLALEASDSLRMATARLEGPDEVCVPFLAELAQRLLALGHLGVPEAPQDDPVLNPQLGRIDPECAHAELAMARVVTALDLQRSDLLALVIARHLAWRAQQAPTGWQEDALSWLLPLLRDDLVQCLLVNGMAAAGPVPQTRTDLPLAWLVPLYVHACKRPTSPSELRWPGGPVALCCTLGLVFSRPREEQWREEFLRTRKAWDGWRDDKYWPVRPFGNNLSDLQCRLTQHIASVFGAGEKRLWKRDRVAGLLKDWPALASFCLPDADAPR